MQTVDTFLKRAILLTGVLLLFASVGFGIYYYITFLVPRDSGKLPDARIEGQEKRVTENPNDPNLRVSAAATYFEQGLYDAAITQAEAALKLSPQHQGAMLILGEAWLKRGEEENAIEAFQKLIDANRDSSIARSNRNLGAAYFEMGQIQARRGRLSEAIASYSSALQVDSTDADARVGLARAHEASGHHDDAVGEFKAATRFVPDFKEAYEGLLTCYEAQGRPEGVAFAQGMVAYSSGDYPRAATSLKGAVAQAPSSAEAHLGLGLALEELGQTGEALTEYQTSLGIESTNLLAKISLDRLRKRLQSGLTGS